VADPNTPAPDAGADAAPAEAPSEQQIVGELEGARPIEYDDAHDSAEEAIARRAAERREREAQTAAGLTPLAEGQGGDPQPEPQAEIAAQQPDGQQPAPPQPAPQPQAPAGERKFRVKVDNIVRDVTSAQLLEALDNGTADPNEIVDIAQLRVAAHRRFLEADHLTKTLREVAHTPQAGRQPPAPEPPPAAPAQADDTSGSDWKDLRKDLSDKIAHGSAEDVEAALDRLVEHVRKSATPAATVTPDQVVELVQQLRLQDTAQAALEGLTSEYRQVFDNEDLAEMAAGRAQREMRNDILAAVPNARPDIVARLSPAQIGNYHADLVRFGRIGRTADQVMREATRYVAEHYARAADGSPDPSTPPARPSQPSAPAIPAQPQQTIEERRVAKSMMPSIPAAATGKAPQAPGPKSRSQIIEEERSARV